MIFSKKILIVATFLVSITPITYTLADEVESLEADITIELSALVDICLQSTSLDVLLTCEQVFYSNEEVYVSNQGDPDKRVRITRSEFHKLLPDLSKVAIYDKEIIRTSGAACKKKWLEWRFYKSTHCIGGQNVTILYLVSLYSCIDADGKSVGTALEAHAVSLPPTGKCSKSLYSSVDDFLVKKKGYKKWTKPSK